MMHDRNIVTTTDVYIYILLYIILATDVNKYSLASARCQQRWRINLGNWIYV